MESVCKLTQDLIIKDLGKDVDYLAAWQLQETTFNDILNKKKSGKSFSNYIIICEHNSVYTIGRSFNENDIKAYDHVLNFINTPDIKSKTVNLPLSTRAFNKRNDAQTENEVQPLKSFLDGKRYTQLTPCYYINRGGSITYHGPGQIIIYPIIDLASWHKDLHKYLRTLEQAVIDCLQDFDIAASRINGLTGVWAITDGFITQTPSTKKNKKANIETAAFSEKRKICSIGVRASSWITMHGLALNVNTNMSYFDKIDPCGLKNKKATSMKEILLKEMVLKTHTFIDKGSSKIDKKLFHNKMGNSPKDVDIDAVKAKLVYYLKKGLGF